MNNPETSLIKSLPPELRRVAIALRVTVLLLFLAGCLTATYLVLFPSRTFEFFFRTPSALKNTIVNPRLGNEAVAKGNVPQDGMLIFDTNLLGDFSQAKVLLQLEKKSAPLENGKVKMRKSYRAFFYPEGGVAPLPEGTLLVANGKQMIVSDGKLRPFANAAIAQQLGFSREMFTVVDSSVLSNLPTGEPITAAQYPNGTYFQIEEEYYQLSGGELVKFVSENAFFSRADARQAIVKTTELMQTFPLSEKLLGFRDSSLVSSADSVFILSDGKRYPIDNTFTFEAMGLSWDDVLPVTADELSLYEKQKLFTQNSPHPDGTVFTDRKSGKSYLIQNDTKRPFADPILAQMYLRKANAVFVDNESVLISNSCNFEKKFNLFAKTYECTLPIGTLHDLAGNNYEFQVSSASAVQLEYAVTTFNKVIGRDNSLSSLAEIKRRILNTYYGTQQ